MVKEPILYIDDEKENLENFELTFFRDYTIYTTQSAEEGYEIVKKHPIKVVISDQRMPKVSGVEFLNEIKKINPDIIRIILTGYTDEADILNAINQSEVYRYITKPWKRQEIKLTIDNGIEIYNLKSENKNLFENLKHQYQILEEEEKRYRLLFESANDGIVLLKNDRIIDANTKCLELFGYQHEEFINKTPRDLSPEKQPDGSDSKDSIYKKLSIVTGGKNKVFDWQHKKKDGSLFDAEISLNSFLQNDATVVMALVRDITDRKNIEKKLLETIIDTEEKERMRFAQDLHDEVGPLLSSLKMYISALKDIKKEEKLKEFTERSLDLIVETISTVRRTSNALSPHILNNFGLKTAIEALIENNQKFIDISLESNFNEERFNSNIEIVYYRIIKELVNNTLKHANADKIKIVLKYNQAKLSLVFTDNGKGFDIEKELNTSKGGIGILNILNRVKTIGGEYYFENVENKGIIFGLTTKVEKTEINNE